jgi:glycosyltransferase involved in cell wall biosynthesis
LGGLKTVVTYHSKNYQHDKWGFFAKIMLKAGEKCVGALADEVIFISETQARLFSWNNKTYIPNGVSIQTPSISTSYLTQIGVEPREYLLAVARFAPEKGLHDLISAFKLIDTKRKLVIAGDADHETEYSRNLRHLASQDNRIILTGYITGEPLNQVYSHARLFVLPSYHEGLPIALLEAMSYGLPVLVSDIPANREVGLPGDRYFRCGDVTDLKEKMLRLLGNDISIIEQERLRKLIEEKYNWDEIAEQTINVYRKALKTTETRRNVGSKVLVGARVKTP